MVCCLPRGTWAGGQGVVPPPKGVSAGRTTGCRLHLHWQIVRGERESVGRSDARPGKLTAFPVGLALSNAEIAALVRSYRSLGVFVLLAGREGRTSSSEWTVTEKEQPRRDDWAADRPFGLTSPSSWLKLNLRGLAEASFHLRAKEAFFSYAVSPKAFPEHRVSPDSWHGLKRGATASCRISLL